MKFYFAEENPKKKRSKKDDNSKKTVKPAFLDIDESSNGMVQGLNLSSTTMILFDEVSICVILDIFIRVFTFRMVLDKR